MSYVTAGNSLLTPGVCIVYSRVSDVVLLGVVGVVVLLRLSEPPFELTPARGCLSLSPLGGASIRNRCSDLNV